MNTDKAPKISDHVAALLRRLLHQAPDDGARHSFPPGRGGSRVANKATDLELVRQWDKIGKAVTRGGVTLTPIVDKARAALRKYDLSCLPEGVTVSTDLTVWYSDPDDGLGGRKRPVKIGELGRGGAARGVGPRWSAVYTPEGGHPEMLASRTLGSYIEAARAVCKAHGLALPGEDPPLPEAA